MVLGPKAELDTKRPELQCLFPALPNIHHLQSHCHCPFLPAEGEACQGLRDLMGKLTPTLLDPVLEVSSRPGTTLCSRWKPQPPPSRMCDSAPSCTQHHSGSGGGGLNKHRMIKSQHKRLSSRGWEEAMCGRGCLSAFPGPGSALPYPWHTSGRWAHTGTPGVGANELDLTYPPTKKQSWTLPHTIDKT